jgi:hypothetical protein
MRSNRMRVLVTGAAALAVGIYAENTFSKEKEPSRADPAAVAVDKGIKWLVSVQGNDGGWGQDGGETSYVRQGERLESKGNDVANTAVAAEAILHAGSTPTSGPYRQNLTRAVKFILQHVEQSPAEGLAVTDQQGTQIQRKLGPYIDTFLTSRLLAELDGNMGDAKENARVRRGLEKCVAKIEKNQLKDGSWNISGGWAPILGTSLASQSLYIANGKGVRVQPTTMAKVDDYSKQTASAKPAEGVGAGVGGGVGPGIGGGVARDRVYGSSAGLATETMAVAASVPLYKQAQELEQLSRTDADRKKNAKQIDAIKGQLNNARFVTGFGSIGGEEFFSYLNISDSLHRTGGPEWEKWNGDIKTKVVKMQNEDGTWAGHHCITGRVAVTSAAILTLRCEREPAIVTTSKKN